MTTAHSVLPGYFGPFRNQPLEKAHSRAGCGASAVAIMREGEVLPTRGPDVVLHMGDLLVTVGIHEIPDTAAEILRHG